MLIYHYDSSGIFLTSGEARPSPKDGFYPDGEPKCWLVPANATLIAPPETTPGQVAVWSDSGWTLTEDNRGAWMYRKTDGYPQRMRMLGPIPDAFTLVPRPDSGHRWDDANGCWVPDLGVLEELARSERNAKLAASDWTQLPDVTLTEEQKAAWSAYRQALRDYMTDWLPGKPWPVTPE